MPLRGRRCDALLGGNAKDVEAIISGEAARTAIAIAIDGGGGSRRGSRGCHGLGGRGSGCQSRCGGDAYRRRRRFRRGLGTDSSTPVRLRREHYEPPAPRPAVHHWPTQAAAVAVAVVSAPAANAGAPSITTSAAAV